MRLALLFGCVFTLLLCSLVASGRGDDSPGFFLKITKNVPRLGRRADKAFESYFLKNMKVIPRIGRRGDNPNEVSELLTWLDDVPQPDKRVLMSPAAAVAAAEREYSVVQPVNANTLIELLEKDAIPSENVKFVHWKDFDRALQMDSDLYAKVISLGRNPDQSLKEDLRFVNKLPMFDPLYEGGAARTDFMYYNKGANELYPVGKLNRDFSRYNHLI